MKEVPLILILFLLKQKPKKRLEELRDGLVSINTKLGGSQGAAGEPAEARQASDFSFCSNF